MYVHFLLDFFKLENEAKKKWKNVEDFENKNLFEKVKACVYLDVSDKTFLLTKKSKKNNFKKLASLDFCEYSGKAWRQIRL